MGALRDKIMQKVTEVLINDNTFIDNLVDSVIANTCYTDLVNELNISDSTIAYYINSNDVAEKAAEEIDLGELASELDLDYNRIAKGVVKTLDNDFYEEIIGSLTEQIKEDIINS